jgi:hypothetical protein
MQVSVVKEEKGKERRKEGNGRPTVNPVRVVKAYGAWRYSHSHSQPRQLMEISSKFHAPAALAEVPIPLEAGWTPEPVRMVSREKLSFPSRGLSHDYQLVEQE